MRTVEAGKNSCSLEKFYRSNILCDQRSLDGVSWQVTALLARCGVWVPLGDQPKQYKGHQFGDFVLHEFQETLDGPRSFENIDRSVEIRALLDKAGGRNRAFHFDLLWHSQAV